MSDFAVVKLLDKMQIVNIPSGLVPKGAYDASTDYAVGDSVDYLGSSYVMFNDAVAGTLPTDTDYWQVIAEKGDTGETGPVGSVDGAPAIVLEEITTPANPNSNYLKIYAKSNGKVYKLTSGGEETEIVSSVDLSDYLKIDQTVPQTLVGTFTFPIVHTPTINGGILANDDITIQGTTHTTRTTSYVILQPNGGNVGIGTTSPASRLSIVSSGNDTIPLSVYANDGSNLFNVREDATGAGFVNIRTAGGGVAINLNSVGNSYFTGGNVGIGTTSPSVKLDVAGQAKITSSTFPSLYTIRETTVTDSLASGILLETKTSGDMTDGFGGGFIFGLSDTGYSGASANGQARIYAKRDGGDIYASLGFYTTNLSTDPNPKVIIRANGNVGIGTISPTYDLSFGGNSARTIWLERHTTANTAGNSLTIRAGGATAGATNKAGGDLLLYPGVSTGTGESGVSIYGYVAGSTGTADTTPALGIQVLGDKIGFFSVTPVTRQTALTDTLTTITFTEPNTPDYEIQDLTQTNPFGFATKDEGNSVLSVIANLQTRVNELEAKLTAYGLLEA